MERAAGIVTTNPSSDVSDHAKSLVELADTYVITTDGRALDVYTEAWEMLADPEFDDLRYQLFGTPKMLFPDEPIQPVLARHPMNAVVGDELFVDIEYDIRHDGRVRNVKIVEGNVPNEEKKMLKTYVSRLKYRPRIVEGEFFMTEGLSWHQTFRVLEKVPEPTNVSPVVVGDGS